MTRTRFFARCPNSRLVNRFASVSAAVWLFVSLGAGTGVAGEPVRIAVAPLAGSEYGERAAEAIVTDLRRRPLDRVIAPGSFIAEATLDPSAEEVRRWAYSAAVETVVVGRVVATSEEAKESYGEHRVEIAVRSGHSGAEIARHDTVIPSPDYLEFAGQRLAAAILEDLDYSEPVAGSAEAQDSLHAVGFLPSRRSSTQAGGGTEVEHQGSGRGRDASLDVAGFDNDAPLEIKADEAEIIDRDGGRELIFQNNVQVRKANVTLRSDYLQATYRKGESEPEKLVARGKVFVDQGDRRARCDRAVYMREEQRLICSGHAELVQGCDIVRGDSIQFDLGKDRARVEGAASIVIQPDGDADVTCGPAGGVM